MSGATPEAGSGSAPTDPKVERKPSFVGKLKKRLSFSREKESKDKAPVSPTVKDDAETVPTGLDAVTEKGESKFLHLESVQAAPGSTDAAPSSSNSAPTGSTTATPVDATPASSTPSTPTPTTIPAPYPVTELAKAPSVSETAAKIRDAVSRVPWLPGNPVTPQETLRIDLEAVREVTDDLTESSEDAKLISAEEIATEDAQVQEQLWNVRRDPKTGRPLPPYSVVPSQARDEELIQLLQCVPYMNGSAVSQPVVKKKGLKAVPNLLRLKTKGATVDQTKGVIAALEELAAFPWSDGSTSGPSDPSGSDPQEEDKYSKVVGGGLMLYAPIQPADDDKVELADIKVQSLDSDSPRPDPSADTDVGGGKAPKKRMSLRDPNAELWSIPWPWKKKGGATESAPPGNGDDAAIPAEPAEPAPTPAGGTEPSADTTAGGDAPTGTAPSTTDDAPTATTPVTSDDPPVTSTPGTDTGSDTDTPPSTSTPSTTTNPPVTTTSTTTWVPSTTKLSFEALWWGFKLYLPPSVLDVLSADEVDAVKFTTIITDALMWLFDHIPVSDIPTSLQPVFLVLQKIAPYISYIGTFISWSWGEIQSYNQGYGVILTATWILPVVLIPSTWSAADWPGGPTGSSTPTTPTGTTSPPTNPTSSTSGTGTGAGSAPASGDGSSSTTVPPSSASTGVTTTTTTAAADGETTVTETTVVAESVAVSPVSGKRKVWRW